ncbi:MAG: hypothetical protein PHQ35_00125 [Phycisphaerae bacterium]|nr:hypothetical protein [Phycisphaerae bacterium]MDD5381634.1 hypothetical protein [Phycisphaerae bacterium]
MIKTGFKLRTTNHEPRTRLASALIIAVILTSLLAIIGMMFVMIARVDKMSTSAISQNKDLDSVAEAVVAKISQELVLDVPGVAGQEYYDYPDANSNAWLASLEPYKSGTNYYWRRISDIYNRLDANDLPAGIVPDYQSSIAEDVSADADGDGVADSKWVKLDDITSSKGKSIYAAVRIVDNGAMLNVNTAYEFDPNAGSSNRIDGSSQTQIDLFTLAQRSLSNTIGQLDDARFGDEPLPHNLDDYIRDVVWRYNEPDGNYAPFDISDELEIRNRFTLNRTGVDCRLENFWADAFKGAGYLSTPVTVTAGNYSDWLEEVHYDSLVPTAYSYRHIGTIYNMDRIITPDCNKMTNINTADVNTLCESIRRILSDANYPDVNSVSAQIAVNLIDFRDSDSNDITVYYNPDDDESYYGFEQPCIYISELAHKFKQDSVDPTIVYTSYAIELYKPYAGDSDPCGWQLVSGGGKIQINNWTAGEQYYVILNEDPCVPLDVNTGTTVQPYSFSFAAGDEIELQRPLPGGGHIKVDSKVVPDPCGGWLDYSGNPRSIQRDIDRHKCIRRLWAGAADVCTPTLGSYNSYSSSDSNMIQAHPENKPFTNIGEIGMILRKRAYPDQYVPYAMNSNDTEATARVDLADPNFQKLFKYFTVLDPAVYSWNDPNETRVKGRININTAPWYVLAQLPWVSQKSSGNDDANLARAIVAYRDQDNLLSSGGPDYSGRSGEPGFRGIGELNRVVAGPDNYSMNYYILGAERNIDLPGFPDLTTPAPSLGDGAPYDFEERDVIFSRISNLVTVRSDVFTAYILVRIGRDGPQKRVMAILDRSNVYPGSGKVRVIAIHPVPDPR